MMEMAADGCDDGNERLSHHNEGGMMRDGWFSKDNGSGWVWWWWAGLMMMAAMTHSDGTVNLSLAPTCISLQQYRSTITPTTMDDGYMAGYHYHPLLRSTSRTLHSWLYPPTNRPCPRMWSRTVGGKFSWFQNHVDLSSRHFDILYRTSTCIYLSTPIYQYYWIFSRLGVVQ